MTGDADTTDARLLAAARARLDAARELEQANRAHEFTKEQQRVAALNYQAAVEKFNQLESDIARGVRPRIKPEDSK